MTANVGWASFRKRDAKELMSRGTTTCLVAQGPISPVKRLRKLVKLSVSGGRRGTTLSVFLNKLNNRQSTSNRVKRD